MTQWEFQALKNESPAAIADVVERFNDLGMKGWELCGFEYGYAIFKRPILDRLSDEDPRDKVIVDPNDPGTKWFLNECGDPYPYPAHLQTEHYPNDDHVPYDSEEAAERAAAEVEFEVQVTIGLTVQDRDGEEWSEDAAADWVQTLLADVRSDEVYGSGMDPGDSVRAWSFEVGDVRLEPNGAVDPNDGFLAEVEKFKNVYGDFEPEHTRRMALDYVKKIDSILRIEDPSPEQARRLSSAREWIATNIFGVSGPSMVLS